MSYYINQLSNLNTSDSTALNIKIIGTDGETKWLTLNSESVSALVQWLNETFPECDVSKKENFKDSLLSFNIPDWAICAIVNGDRGTLSEQDMVKLDRFLAGLSEKYGNASLLLGDNEGEDNLGFLHRNDICNLGTNCFRMYLKPSNDI